MSELKIKCPDCEATILVEIDWTDGEFEIISSKHAS